MCLSFTILLKVAIGENYLEEIDVFKKTYVILYTHLNDFTRQAQKLFTKYTNEFARALFVNGMSIEQLDASNYECITAVACETALNGCLFTKLWPAVLKAHERDDTQLVNRMNLVRIKLGLDSAAPLSDEPLDESTVNECVRFFNLEPIYFSVGLRAVSKELRKIEMLNNPLEKLESLKASVDLLVNELTKLSMTATTSIMVTSENLIPLMAFVLIRSNLVYLKSIVYYVDCFSFSSVLPHVNSNNFIAELAYFMTTLKAAISFIENTS